MRLAHCVLATGLTVGLVGAVGAQEDATPELYAAAATPTLSAAAEQAQAQAVIEYWTPERMASARPMPTPTRLATEGSSPRSTPAPPGPPTVVNGWRSGTGPYVPKVRTLTPAEAESLGGQGPQTFGSAPGNPLAGPYGPFQRWTMEGTYLPWARGVHGKLFFSLDGSNHTCSAEVFGRSSIVTASHCLHGGPGGSWANNFLFCPSYYNGGEGGAGIPHPARGCWPGSAAQSTFPWIQNGDVDYDYGCIVLATTGTVVSDKVGNVTGWAGRAWNFADVLEIVFGYSFAAPVIQEVAGVDWYNWDFTAGGQVSKVMGNDLMGGADGGGWFLSWRAPATEFPDTDDNPYTDPAGALNGPFVNGVTSARRCLINCQRPPTTTSGIFWEEASSPPFRSGATGEDWESEDIFATGACLAHPNNDP